MAEFLVCLVILALSPLTDKHKDEGPQAFLRRGAAVCALFFILALVASGGRGPGKVAAGFGGIVTLTLLISSRSVFTVLAERFNDRSDGPAGPDPDPIGDAVDAATDLGGQLGFTPSGTNPAGGTTSTGGGVGLGPGGVPLGNGQPGLPIL